MLLSDRSDNMNQTIHKKILIYQINPFYTEVCIYPSLPSLTTPSNTLIDRKLHGLFTSIHFMWLKLGKLGKFDVWNFPSCFLAQKFAFRTLHTVYFWRQKHGVLGSTRHSGKSNGNRVLPCYLLSRFLVILGKVFTNLYKKLSLKGNS